MATIADGSAPVPTDEPSLLLRAEIKRLREEAARMHALAHRRADFWAKADIALGFPAALLAGIAGAAGLATADARIPAALIALASASFGAGAGFLRSGRRCLGNKRARAAWARLEGAATVKLSQDHLRPEDLADLLELRQAALGAYEADEPQGPPPPAITA
ncbi:hypothetical protein [Streptomyces sp. NPDC002889]|uniref:hypothetical protein n=1 Tax=Streptomyces sp. NPDC002889 TaxID=3364669 RepID=UPI00369D238A